LDAFLPEGASRTVRASVSHQSPTGNPEPNHSEAAPPSSAIRLLATTLNNLSIDITALRQWIIALTILVGLLVVSVMVLMFRTA
jgi:hypothetical protein